MAGLGDLFGKGSIAEQFLIWGVMQQLAGAGMAPGLQSLQSEVWKLDPSMPVSPSLLADMVHRGLMDDTTGKSEAVRSGIGPDAFEIMVKGATQSPSLGALIQGYQRKIVADSDFERGLVELGIDPLWHDLIRQLTINIPTSDEALNAFLEGQVSDGEAKARYLAAGGDPTWYETDKAARGSAPSPVELGNMVNRGIIPAEGTGVDATTFQQGFLEGPWRNKWLPKMLELSKYRPPPRTITALIHEGVLDDATALEWFKGWGMDAATAAVYLKSAHSGKTSAAKDLSVSNIETMYRDKLITESEASAHLVALGYPQQAATELLKLADFNNQQTSIRSAQSKIRTLYVGRKITPAGAKAALVKLGVADADVASLLLIWDIELDATVRQLTEAQVVNAWYYKVMTDSEALANLEILGYTPYDAWVILSVKNKAPLPGKPAKGPGGIAPFE